MESPKSPSPSRAKPTCGICGQEGHNRTTCKSKPQAPGGGSPASKTKATTRGAHHPDVPDILAILAIGSARRPLGPPPRRQQVELREGNAPEAEEEDDAQNAPEEDDDDEKEDEEEEGRGALNAPEEDEQAPTPAEKTLQELGYCHCQPGTCKTGHCVCKSSGRACDPTCCGCCSSGACASCHNLRGRPPVHRETSIADLLDVLPVFRVGEEEEEGGGLVVASWNVQSFGHNMFWRPRDAGPDFVARFSRPFLAASERIAAFILHHGVDLLFVQETIDPRALEHVVTNGLGGSYRVAWVPAWVAIGVGFNKSDAKNRPVEYAAVIHKISMSIETPLAVHNLRLDGLHEALPEPRHSFKRLPAHVVVQHGSERLCFVSLHLASDSGVQSLRLNAEIAALGPLTASLRELTAADHVVLLGDFNRGPSSVMFSDLVESGQLPALLSGHTNTGVMPHLYDNFFLPAALRARASVSICGEDEWMVLDDRQPKPRKTSDHCPIIMRL